MSVVLSADDEELVAAARSVIAANYEYGRHEIGAAVRTRSGKVFAGIHVEANVGRITVCGEAVALGAAFSAGQRGIDTVVAVAHPHPHERVPESWVVAPCGMCRELISDYDDGADVIMPAGDALGKVSVLDLLPFKYSNDPPAE